MPSTNIAPSMPAADISTIVWVVFIICIVIVIPTTLAFFYHWGRFAPSHFGAIATIAIYTVGLSIILLGMLGIVLTI